MRPLIQIKVTGYNLDQLINRLHSKGIVCYNIVREQNNIVFFSIKIKDFVKTKQLLKTYEYTMKHLGFANIKNFLINNIATLIAIPIAVTLMIICSHFTWNIKVYGADSELHNQVISVLSDNNISVGKGLPNNSEVEQILLKQLPNVAQVSCINRGTTLIINISKKLVYVPETYEPIRATISGIVTNFSLISGTMAVSIGDFVSAGDILVYPFTLDKNANQVKVKPIAEVRAKAYVVGTSKLNASSTELARTGKTYTISSMQFLNKNLFSKKVQKPFALYETYVYNQYISSVLPIVKTTTIYYELDYVVVEHDLVAGQGNVEAESKALAYNNLPTNSEILDEQTSSLIVNDCLYSTTTLTISTIIS